MSDKTSEKYAVDEIIEREQELIALWGELKLAQNALEKAVTSAQVRECNNWIDEIKTKIGGNDNA